MGNRYGGSSWGIVMGYRYGESLWGIVMGYRYGVSLWGIVMGKRHVRKIVQQLTQLTQITVRLKSVALQFPVCLHR